MNVLSYKQRITIAQLAFVGAILAVLWFPIAALGVKYGLWGVGTGLIDMTINGGPLVLGIAGGLAGLAFIAALMGMPRTKPMLLAVVAALVIGITAYSFTAKRADSARMPPIHDIQTNWNDPIEPSAGLLEARELAQAPNSIESAPIIPETADRRWPGMGNKLVAQAQEEAECNDAADACGETQPYPSLETLTSAVAGELVMPIALDLFERNGWEIVTYDLQLGQLEGTATTGWYGFEDDVMVRVQTSTLTGETLIDARSTSRLGFTDQGANARRLAQLLVSLEIELQAMDKR